MVGLYLGITILFIYILTALVISLFQERFIFKSLLLDEEYQYPFTIPFTEHTTLTSRQGKISSVHFKHPKEKGCILFFHGTRGRIESWQPTAETFLSLGYSCWMVDYRGYGKSRGKRNEQVMEQDMNELYQFVCTQYKPEQIVIYGRSLGSIFATSIARDNAIHRLILENPIRSIKQQAIKKMSKFFPYDWILRYHYDNLPNLAQANVPTSIIHATEDTTAPFIESQKIVDVLPNIQLIPLKDIGHFDIHLHPDYTKAIQQALVNPI